MFLITFWEEQKIKINARADKMKIWNTYFVVQNWTILTEYVNVHKGNISHTKTILENFKENMNKREMYSMWSSQSFCTSWPTFARQDDLNPIRFEVHMIIFHVKVLKVGFFSFNLTQSFSPSKVLLTPQSVDHHTPIFAPSDGQTHAPLHALYGSGSETLEFLMQLPHF